MSKEYFPDFRDLTRAAFVAGPMLLAACGGRSDLLTSGAAETSGTGGTPDAGESCKSISIGPSPQKLKDAVRGQVGALAACFAFTNNCSASAKLTGLELHHIAAGKETDFSDVYLGKDSSTTAKIDPETQTVSLTGDIDLPGNTTTTVCVAADVRPDAMCGDQHGFEIISPNDVSILDDNGDVIPPSNISAAPQVNGGGPISISCES